MVFTKTPLLAQGTTVTLHHRVAPAKTFESISMLQVPGRQVFSATVANPATSGAIIEWFVSAGDNLVFPAGGDVEGGAFTTVVV